MHSILTTAANLLPYHLLSYGTLLGTEIYQSFINTKLCFQALPPREFLVLQKRLFPVYFGCQVSLAALTAATRPPYGVISLAKEGWSAAPLVVVLATGTLNWLVYGPKTTTTAFIRRALQESQSDAVDSDSGKIRQASRNFTRSHAMAIHLNAVALVATIWYGFSLSSAFLEGL